MKKEINFDIDSTRKKMLVEGIDEINFTLHFNDQILNYEKSSKIAEYNKYLIQDISIFIGNKFEFES